MLASSANAKANIDEVESRRMARSPRRNDSRPDAHPVRWRHSDGSDGLPARKAQGSSGIAERSSAATFQAELRSAYYIITSAFPARDDLLADLDGDLVLRTAAVDDDEAMRRRDRELAIAERD